MSWTWVSSELRFKTIYGLTSRTQGSYARSWEVLGCLISRHKQRVPTLSSTGEGEPHIPPGWTLAVQCIKGHPAPRFPNTSREHFTQQRDPSDTLSSTASVGKNKITHENHQPQAKIPCVWCKAQDSDGFLVNWRRHIGACGLHSYREPLLAVCFQPPTLPTAEAHAYIFTGSQSLQATG